MGFFVFLKSEIIPKLNPLHIFNRVISGNGETGSRGLGVGGKQRRGQGAMTEESTPVSSLPAGSVNSHITFEFLFLFIPLWFGEE